MVIDTLEVKLKVKLSLWSAIKMRIAGIKSVDNSTHNIVNTVQDALSSGKILIDKRALI